MTAHPFGVPARVRPADFHGRYAFSDDGWPGSLTLGEGTGRTLTAAFHSYRFDADYEVTAIVSRERSNEIVIRIHEFNALDEQVFTGYLFTQARNAIVGQTEWKGSPFGFVGRKSRPRTLSPFRGGPAEASDFGGSFSVYCDGHHATMETTLEDANRLEGLWRWSTSSETMPISIRTDDGVPQRCSLVAGTPRTPRFTGCIFTRSKNVIAGWVEDGDARMGCYMVRIA